MKDQTKVCRYNTPLHTQTQQSGISMETEYHSKEANHATQSTQTTLVYRQSVT